MSATTRSNDTKEHRHEHQHHPTSKTGSLAATVLSTNLVLSLSAVSLAALVTACGAETDPSDPVTRSDKVAEAAQNYAGDPWEKRFTGGLLQRPRHLGRLAAAPGAPPAPRDMTDDGRPPARPGVRDHTVGPYDQDPNTSAEAWTRRLEAVQGMRD